MNPSIHSITQACWFILSLCGATMTWAYTPQSAIQGDEQYNQESCVQRYTEKCINLVCVPRNTDASKSPHCTQDCASEAQAKCRAER
jgi:hypothetical protein